MNGAPWVFCRILYYVTVLLSFCDNRGLFTLNERRPWVFCRTLYYVTVLLSFGGNKGLFTLRKSKRETELFL